MLSTSITAHEDIVIIREFIIIYAARVVGVEMMTWTTSELVVLGWGKLGIVVTWMGWCVLDVVTGMG